MLALALFHAGVFGLFVYSDYYFQAVVKSPDGSEL